MLSITLKIPELALEEEEAAKLEDAINRVWKHYPADVSQKQLDISMAIFTAATIYGTRAVAIVARKRGENNAPPQQENFGGGGSVFPFPTVPNQGGFTG